MARDLNVDQIKKLWILDLVLQTGSLKKAALQAKVSPSAISQSLTSLEHSVGRRLLIREAGRINPTPEALTILEVVRPAFAAFDRLRDLQNTPVPKMSWLNFGTYESIAIDILPGMIHSLRQRLPSLRLGLRISRTANLLTMVRKGELCSALITEVDDLSRFYKKDVATDRLGLYVARHVSSAEGDLRLPSKIGLGSLAGGKDGLPRYFTKFMRQLENAPPLILSDSFETLRAAAAAGALVAVLPHRIAMRHPDLREITPGPKIFRERGHHSISVISLSNCDPAETDFLAAEASRHFKNLGPN